MKPFISEEDLNTLEGWLRYQGVDPSTLKPNELSQWTAMYSDSRAKAAAQPKIGRMKLRPLRAGEYRYGVAQREGADLWLTLWVRRSPKGEFFVMIPRGSEGGDPHNSYHVDGKLHAKSYRQKFASPMKRQPLGSNFKGAVHLGSYAAHAPKTVGAICDPADFSGIVEVPPGLLGPRHGAVTVDLVEPGHEHELHQHPWAEIYHRVTLKDASPWVVVTVGRPMGEAR